MHIDIYRSKIVDISTVLDREQALPKSLKTTLNTSALSPRACITRRSLKDSVVIEVVTVLKRLILDAIALLAIQDQDASM